MDVDPSFSSTRGGVISYLQGPDRFFVNELGGSVRNLTWGISSDSGASYVTMYVGGTNAAVYSIMGVGEGVFTPNSTMITVL